MSKFITEISNYTWDKDLNGKMLNRPVDSFNHLMDAMRYAVEEISNGEISVLNNNVKHNKN